MVNPTWHWDWLYQRYLQAALDRITTGETKRLILQVPIRHGKSELATIRYPVYRMEADRSLRVVVACHTQELASKFGRKSRRLAESRFPLSQDRTAAHDWETPAGGRYRSVGVGGAVIGDGFDLLIVDDPFKSRQEAESATIRENVWDWFSGDLYGRQEPGATMVLIMSRWHEDDIIGRALAGGTGDEWENIRLPALAEEDDPLGREVGEALCPERYDAECLRNREAAKPYEFLSQYQQRPTPKEGSFFKVAQLEIVEAVPACLETVRAWDQAATEGDGDYTAGAKIGRDAQGIFYVLDVVREQLSTDMRNRLILQTAALDGRGVSIHGAQDPGNAGKDAALAFTRMLAGYVVKTEPATGAKEVRADPFSAQVNAGNVKLLRGDWNKDFIEELRQFPNGKYDDQADAVADGFNELGQVFHVQQFSYLRPSGS